MNRYLFLCGLKSCGKTSAGRHLDQSLNDSVFIDLDDVLLEESKEKNISTLYKMMGENMFRKYESEIFNKVINVCNENWHEKLIIIALGGGSCNSPDILNNANKIGRTVYIWCHEKILYGRYMKNGFPQYLSEEKDICNKRAKFHDIYKKRDGIYSSKCQFMLKSDAKSVDEISKEIAVIIGKN